MLKRVKNFFISRFSTLQMALKSTLFILVSFTAFFLVLSDRNPYNYVAFALYGIDTILMIFYIAKYGKIQIDLFGILLLGFLLVILVSQILNMSFFNYPRTLFLLSIFAFIFYQYLLTLNPDEKLLVFKFIFIGGCIMAIFFLAYYFPDSFKFKFEQRLGRDLSDQNDLAKHFALFCVLGEYFSFKTKGKWKIPYIISCLLFAYVLLLTGSISNLLVLSLLTIGLIIYMVKGKRKLIAIAGVVATIILFIILLQIPSMSYFKTRIENMFNTITSGTGSVDYSFIDRFNLAIYGLRLFTSKPLFGYGYDQVQFYTWGKDAFSHNNFVELLASFGILGFLIFEFMLLYPIYKCWKKEGKEITVFLLLYLFAFQLFLIIYRKKIEYFVIPIAFSLIDLKKYKTISFDFSQKKFKIEGESKRKKKIYEKTNGIDTLEI